VKSFWTASAKEQKVKLSEYVKSTPSKRADPEMEKKIVQWWNARNPEAPVVKVIFLDFDYNLRVTNTIEYCVNPSEPWWYIKTNKELVVCNGIVLDTSTWAEALLTTPSLHGLPVTINAGAIGSILREWK